MIDRGGIKEGERQTEDMGSQEKRWGGGVRLSERGHTERESAGQTVAGSDTQRGRKREEERQGGRERHRVERQKLRESIQTRRENRIFC